MKKKFYIFIYLASLFFIFGCNHSVEIPSQKSSSDSLSFLNSSSEESEFIINDERKAQIENVSVDFKTSELKNLNKKNNEKPISDLYFLDNDHIIFSAVNGKNNTDDSENCDFYQYNLETDTLILLCPGYTLYHDSYIMVKDINNFSIVTGTSYLKIKDNKKAIQRNVFQEAKTKYQYVNAVFYHEDNDKMLVLENDMITRNSSAYVTDSQFSASQKLPFEDIYRVQWADKDHVLVAYKEKDGKSVLAAYNIEDKNIKITALPSNHYFIDPVPSDHGIIRFLYLDDPRTEMPWGFLDLNKGTIDRIYFESCNPESIMRNGRMAGFSQSSSENNQNNQLFLFDNSTKKIGIRDNLIEYPQAVAVSPDGNRIVFVAGNALGQSKFFINQNL